MVEITVAKQSIEKRMKKMKTPKETFGRTLKAPTFSLSKSQKEKRERKDQRKYLKRYWLKTSLTWERKQSTKSRKHRESLAV